MPMGDSALVTTNVPVHTDFPGAIVWNERAHSNVKMEECAPCHPTNVNVLKASMARLVTRGT